VREGDHGGTTSDFEGEARNGYDGVELILEYIG